MKFHGQLTNCVTYYDDVISFDVTYLASKDVITNNEQLNQSFWQSVKEQKFKPKKFERGGQFDSPYGLWGDWGPWSSDCPTDCLPGRKRTRTRTRTCTNPTPQGDELDCTGAKFEQQICGKNKLTCF